jgi:hypothetical protein
MPRSVTRDVAACDFAYFDVTNLPVTELRDEPPLLLLLFDMLRLLVAV